MTQTFTVNSSGEDRAKAREDRAHESYRSGTILARRVQGVSVCGVCGSEVCNPQILLDVFAVRTTFPFEGQTVDFSICLRCIGDLVAAEETLRLRESPPPF